MFTRHFLTTKSAHFVRSPDWPNRFGKFEFFLLRINILRSLPIYFMICSKDTKSNQFSNRKKLNRLIFGDRLKSFKIITNSNDFQITLNDQRSNDPVFLYLKNDLKLYSRYKSWNSWANTAKHSVQGKKLKFAAIIR